jgi:glyoxylase I family protein
MVEVIGIDHVYIAVSDMAKSQAFYDVVMPILGFRRNSFEINGDAHVQYYNRQGGYVLRPAREKRPYDAYAPGLHHFCWRVDSAADVATAARELRAAGIEVTEPALYPQYSPDYSAIFFSDPDGIRLELTNYRQERRNRHEHWDNGGDSH